MNIFVKSFDGKNITISCNKDDSSYVIVSALINKKYNLDDITIHKFLYQGKIIDLEKTISQNNINDLSTIYWYIRHKHGNCAECGF
jgi:hypothetical protein